MNINCLTYNISWATQANKTLGSEADFVEACQNMYKKGGIQCNKNAINNLKKLDQLDLIGLQEVNSNVEPKILKMKHNITHFKRGKIGLSTLSILWNKKVFGKLIHNATINLSNKLDERPCLILIFDTNIMVINVHMPWEQYVDKAIHILQKYLFTDLKKYINKDIKIIMLGDFNDDTTKIHKNKPLVLKYRTKSIKLSHKKNKTQALKTLKSCCWHKKGHQNKFFKNTGDYILVNNNIKQSTIEIPKIFKNPGRYNRLFSDHTPVFSKLKI